jgi:hypothetical protein
MPTTDIAQYSLAAGEPLTATASRASIWILLEYNEVWGAKALEESNLPERVKKLLLATSANLPNVRFQFIKQNGSNEGIRFYIAQAHPINPMLYRFKLESYDDLLDMDIEAVASDRSDQTLSEERLFLVCTNGKRDACCAKNGPPLYNALSNIAGRDVWQTTHLGGHRFSGTMVCLPHGICYGRVPPGEAPAIVQSYQSNTLLPDYYRGCVAYDAPVQAVEAFLRRQTGERSLDAFRLNSVQAEDDNHWLVQFDDIDGAAYHLRVRAEPSTFTVYESTRNAEPNAVMQYIVEG